MLHFFQRSRDVEEELEAANALLSFRAGNFGQPTRAGQTQSGPRPVGPRALVRRSQSVTIQDLWKQA
jgi:hypothetical protein